MRTLKISIMTVLMVFSIWSAGTATGIFEVAIKAKENKSLAVEIVSNDQEAIHVTIKDVGGRTLHQEEAPYPVLNSKVFNLSNLNSGSYVIVVSNETVTYVQPLQVESQTIAIDRTEQKQYFKPHFNELAGVVDINMLTLGEGLSVDIQIDDVRGDVIYYQSVEQISPVEKRMNLNELPAGEYRVSVIVTGTATYDMYSTDVLVGPLVAGR